MKDLKAIQPFNQYIRPRFVSSRSRRYVFVQIQGKETCRNYFMAFHYRL